MYTIPICDVTEQAEWRAWFSWQAAFAAGGRVQRRMQKTQRAMWASAPWLPAEAGASIDFMLGIDGLHTITTSWRVL